MDIEKRAMAKTMRRLLPLLIVSALVAFIDRVNVGFAALGMNRDLGLSASAFGFGAGIFFLTYVIFEVPSNVILASVGARRWIARIMVTWGLIAGGMAFVTGPTSFYILRALLGLAEAGFYPGMLYFLTFWFPAAYRGRVIGLFMLALPASFLIGSPLSGALLTLDGAAGLKGWQWLFLLQAAPALVLSVIVYLYLPDRPEEAKFLTPEEKSWLVQRLQTERAALRGIGREHGSILRAIVDPKVIGLGIVCFCAVIDNYGLGFFLPLIVKSFGLNSMETGLVAAVPYIVGLIAIIVVGWLSDKSGERKYYIAVTFAIAGGFLALSTLFENPLLKMGSFTLAAIGMYGYISPFWSHMGDFLNGMQASAAAAAIAVVNSIANVAGFVGPFAIGYIKDVTQSYSGGLLAIAFASAVGICVLFALGNAPSRNGVLVQRGQKKTGIAY